MNTVPQNASTDIKLQQGLQLLNQGRLPEALSLTLGIVREAPHNEVAWFLLGLIYTGTGQAQEAIHAFSKILALFPDHGAAWAHLASLFAQQGDIKQAERAIEQAISFDDNDANSYQMIAKALTILERHQESLLWYQRASACHPEHIGFLTNQAICQMYLGNIVAARNTLMSVLARAPQFAQAHWLLAGLATAENDEHVKQMQHLLSQFHYPEEEQAFLHYASGKAFEDLNQWPKAFAAFSQGAKVKRSTLFYDEAAEAECFRILIEKCSIEWFQQGHSQSECSPIFILGQPRSGTTLVDRVISAHSSITSAGELRQLDQAIRRLTQKASHPQYCPSLAMAIPRIDSQQLADAYASQLPQHLQSVTHFTDKHPANFVYLPLILRAFPNARVVHLRRNPVDACFSNFKQLYTSAYPHSYELKTLARHYARYDAMMNTWRERFGDRFYDVQYENFVKDIRTQTEKLFCFLGHPLEEQCINFHKQASPVSSASAVQVRQPVHTGSIGRWRRYEKELQPLIEELIAHGVDVSTSLVQ